jgi:hypothetical protein
MAMGFRLLQVVGKGGEQAEQHYDRHGKVVFLTHRSRLRIR